MMHLIYNSDNGHFGVMERGEWDCEGLHCGQTFQVKVDDIWKPTRMEMRDGEWLLAGLQLRGTELENLPIRWRAPERPRKLGGYANEG